MVVGMKAGVCRAAWSGLGMTVSVVPVLLVPVNCVEERDPVELPGHFSVSKAGKGNYDQLKRKQIFDFQDSGNQREIVPTSNSLQERNIYLTIT